jgi:hypothetical protein
MSHERFQARLAALAVGETTMLTRKQLQRIFASGGADQDEGEAEQHAIALAEESQCGVLFRRADECFAVFTKKQRPRRTQP